MKKDNKQQQMNELPEWLQKLWQISPMLAIQAENDYFKLKGNIDKGFSIEQAQELFFAGYFHAPMKELDKKETEIGGLNKQFLKVVERGNY